MNEHVIVALVATKGLEDFLENSLTGLSRVGVDPRIVHVARPDNAADTIDPIVLKAGAVVDSFAAFGQPLPVAIPITMPITERSRLSRSIGRRSAISAGCWIAIAMSSTRTSMSAGSPIPCGTSTPSPGLSARVPDRGAAAISAGAVLGISVREIVNRNAPAVRFHACRL